jgi:xanthine dehydrogenase accessory factor
VPEDVDTLMSDIPADLVKYASPDAEHLVLTYSHAIDLELCHALLAHKFSWAGLIGSKTKWLRFCRRLKELGHHDSQIRRITCPIGRPQFGKHPHQIAIGVATDYLSRKTAIAGSRSIKGEQRFAKSDGAD